MPLTNGNRFHPGLALHSAILQLASGQAEILAAVVVRGSMPLLFQDWYLEVVGTRSTDSVRVRVR